MARARRNDEYTIKVLDDQNVICEFEAVETDDVSSTVDFIKKQIKLNATSSTPYEEILALADSAITDWID